MLPDRAKALDAVAVEQRDDDAGFDVRGGVENDDGPCACACMAFMACMSASRRRGDATVAQTCSIPAAAPSSYRPAARRTPAKTSTSRRIRSRSSSNGRSRMLLDQAASRGVAEAVARRVHRLGDAVGVEHEQVAAAERQRHFLEQPLERLRPRRSAGRAPGRRAPGSAARARRRVRARHVDQRAVAGARVRAASARSRSTTSIGDGDEAAAVEMARR